jgi:hypothetical protein
MFNGCQKQLELETNVFWFLLSFDYSHMFITVLAGFECKKKVPNLNQWC